MEILLLLLGLGSVLFILVIGIVGIVSYFLTSIAIMKMSQRAEIEEAWLAWIPIGNLYLIGKLIHTIEFAGKKYERAELILPGALLGSVFLGRLGVLGNIPNILMCVMTLYGLFMLYRKYTPNKVTKYMLLSVLVPVLGSSLVLFKIKNVDPVHNSIN